MLDFQNACARLTSRYSVYMVLLMANIIIHHLQNGTSGIDTMHPGICTVGY